jgi:hypothetical protein
VGFDPTTPALEKGKAVHALYQAAVVIGRSFTYLFIFLYFSNNFLGYLVVSDMLHLSNI